MLPKVVTHPEPLDQGSSLWAEYYKETGYIELLERQDGFLSFSVDGKIAKIYDVFIRKSARDGKLRRNLFEEVTQIVKARGAESIVGEVDTQLKDSTRTLLFWIKMDAVAFKAENNLVYFVKRI